MYKIPRIEQATPESNAFAYAALIGGIPRIQTESFAVLPGLGENARIFHALARWKGRSFKHLLVAGLFPEERTATNFDIATLRRKPFNLRKTRGVYTQVHADNTPAQAQWLAQRVKELRIRSLTLSAPPYHLPRALGTVVKTFLQAGIGVTDCFVIPEPTPISPLDMVPELSVDAADMMSGEYERVVAYGAKGDVADLNDLIVYVESLIHVLRERRLVV
jgi:hypothetical protein